jgi:hypothetical protein
LGLAIIACTAGTDNVRIEGLPQYICPSATPRPTHTALPTSPPTFPPYFQVNLPAPYYVGMGPINVQIHAQNAGNMYIRYSGFRRLPPYTWEGSFGQFYSMGFSGTTALITNYWLTVPGDVYLVSMTFYADLVSFQQSLSASQITYLPTATPQPPPCCPSSPIYPTGAPTYTPYPTPTPYIRTNDYFVGDIIYSDPQSSGLRLSFRVTDIHSEPSNTLDENVQRQSLHLWTIEIENVGTIPYTIFPPAQLYVAVVRRPNGTELNGVWGPNLAAASEAGVTFDSKMTWDMQDIRPGRKKTFVLAAYAPVGTVYKVSYALDASQRTGGTNPTVVPGSNIVSWINEVNTICSGDIAHP